MSDDTEDLTDFGPPAIAARWVPVYHAGLNRCVIDEARYCAPTQAEAMMLAVQYLAETDLNGLGWQGNVTEIGPRGIRSVGAVIGSLPVRIFAGPLYDEVARVEDIQAKRIARVVRKNGRLG